MALLPIAMLAAGIFGGIHNQISYAVSAEYFTKFKFVQFGLANADTPARIRAFEIGFLASWWMGSFIGLLSGTAGYP